jgi:adenine-specific DNA-methyltransferase
MDGNSLNITQDLLEKLKGLVPQAFSEEKLDMQKLQTLLGEAVNTDNERYQLSWAGKSEAYKVLQMLTTATLIPQPEQSVNWDESENIFIEGENLEVLKVLQKSYYGKIKMIYIDPPYNTGSDSFIYPDKFSETKEEYLKRIGEKDEEGYMMKEGLFRKNSKENGQFHSNWLNMMLPRLFLARNLLKEDGVIFISIDDNEQANLKLLMDEIFGEENFVVQLIWKKRVSPANDSQWFSSDHEYILVYAKNKENWFPIRLKRNEKQNSYYTNPDNDPRGDWNSAAYTCNKSKEERPNLYYPITNPFTGEEIYPKETAVWAYSKETHLQHVEENLLYWGVDGKSKSPRKKQFLSDANRVVPRSFLENSDVGSTQSATLDFLKLFSYNYFNYTKPVNLIKRLIELSCDGNDIVLDFFAGSGTTAQAVLEANSEDGGTRKFICVQLPEKLEEKSKAYEDGYKEISEITLHRIKKAIHLIKDSNNGKMEFNSSQILGFRKYFISPSNFKIWRGDVVENEAELTKQMELFVTPQRANAQSENILWELLIKNGVSLTEKIQRIEVGEDVSIYHTSDKRFAFVLDKYAPEVQEKVLALKPRTVICLDSLFQNQDMVKTNAQLKFEDNDITFKTV